MSAPLIKVCGNPACRAREAWLMKQISTLRTELIGSLENQAELFRQLEEAGAINLDIPKILSE
jgi:hypothetical protein